MRLLYMIKDRVAGAPPPGVAGLLSGGMIPAFIERGIDVAIYGKGSLIKGVPVYTSFEEAVKTFKPSCCYNLVAEQHLHGLEDFIKQRKIPYFEDATHGQLKPHASMRDFDFICQSKLMYERLVYHGFKVHQVTPPFVPMTELQRVKDTKYTNQRSGKILYLHNGDKGIADSIVVCEAIKKRLIVTLAPVPKEKRSRNVIVLGCVDSNLKQNLIETCDALIYCPPEKTPDGKPFIEATCTSAIECLYSGLPVIGVPNQFGRKMCVFQYIEEGGIPAVIRDTKEELIEAIKAGELDKIDKNEVRAKAQAYFNNQKCIDQYVEIFRKVAQNGLSTV